MNISRRLSLIKLWCIVIALTVLSGCSAKLVTYPDFPKNQGTLDYKLHDTPTAKFIVESGKNSIAKDGVTVKIADISDEFDDDRFSTTIIGPDEKEYKASIAPMMLVLKITNSTDHIITLQKTIIKIEDDDQNDFPLISNIPSAKGELVKQVGRSFDEYLKDADDFFKENILNHKDYNSKYDKFVADLTAAFRSGKAKTQDQKDGYYLTKHGFDNMIKNRSPQTLYEENLSRFSKKIYPLKSKAMGKVQSDLPNNINNIITGGVYQPINLIPGRSTKIIVPFNVRRKGEIIKKLHVNIFDLPTKVDNAGNPTKRAHFNFTLKAVN